MSESFRSKIVHAKYANEVTLLRRAAFTKSYGANVNLDKLAYNENDDRFLNIGIFDTPTDRLLSCLRLGMLKTPFDFKKVMNFEYRESLFPLPLASINRVVTDPDFGSRGFHGILRMISIEIAGLCDARGVVGVMEEGSLRLKQMAEIGYELHTIDVPWTGFVKNEKPIVAGILKSENYQAAKATLLSRLESRMASHGFQYQDEIDYPAAEVKMRSTRSFDPAEDFSPGQGSNQGKR